MNIIHLSHFHWDAITSLLAGTKQAVWAQTDHPEYPLMDRLLHAVDRWHALVPRFTPDGHAIQYLRFRQQWLVKMATDAEELAHVFGVFHAKALAEHLRAVATDPACWAQPLEVA